MAKKIKAFLTHVTNYVSAQADCTGLILAGSYASGSAAENSDIDLLLFTDERSKYLEKSEWLREFGTIKNQVREEYGIVSAIRVFYDNGIEVEFGITEPIWYQTPIDAGTHRVISDGTRVLFSKDRGIEKAIKASQQGLISEIDLTTKDLKS